MENLLSDSSDAPRQQCQISNHPFPLLIGANTYQVTSIGPVVATDSYAEFDHQYPEGCKVGLSSNLLVLYSPYQELKLLTPEKTYGFRELEANTLEVSYAEMTDPNARLILQFSDEALMHQCRLTLINFTDPKSPLFQTDISRDSHPQFAHSLTIEADLGTDVGLVNMMTRGAIFLKYNRLTKPKRRHVMLTGDLVRIIWRPLNKPPNKAKKGIDVADIIETRRDRSGKRFRSDVSEVQILRSLTIVTGHRTVDLELETEEVGSTRDLWVRALNKLAFHELNKELVKRCVAGHQ